jgi:hypothetical protein
LLLVVELGPLMVVELVLVDSELELGCRLRLVQPIR